METRISAPGDESAGARSPSEPSSPAYVLEGVVLEASEGRPARRSVAAWFIVRGEVRGVDVSGLTVVTVRDCPDDGRLNRGVLLVDEQAGPEMVVAIVDVVQGRVGEPPAGLAGADAVYQVPIEYELNDERRTVSVPGRLRISLRGTSAAEMSVDFPEHDLGWRASGCAAVYGEFRWER